jgi:transposase-like protein
MDRSIGENDNMTRPYSFAFKQKMIDRLTGKDAVSALQLSRETGIRQQNLSRWLQEARSLPLVRSDDIKARKWTVEQKARILTEASALNAEQLRAYLDREGLPARRTAAEAWLIAIVLQTLRRKLQLAPDPISADSDPLGEYSHHVHQAAV